LSLNYFVFIDFKMFFTVATSLVAALFLVLLAVGVRQRWWTFAAMNFIGTGLNAAMVILDLWGQLNMTTLLAAMPALAFVLAADIAIIFREPREKKKSAAARDDEPVAAGSESNFTHHLVTNEKRFRRELDCLDSLPARKREAALDFWRQGNAAFRHHHDHEAQINYEKSIQLAPAPSALSNLAAVLLAVNRPQAALQCCKDSFALDPQHLETLLIRGGALLRLERRPEALACFDHAVALQPNMLEPWLQRGNVLAQMGQCESSIESYDTALRLNPRRPDCWNNRGVALSKMNRLPEAITSFERALKIQPDYFPASLNRVLVIDKLGRSDQAKLYYRNFIKHAPPAMNGRLVFVRSRLHQLESGAVSRDDLNQLELELAL
jgi:tetratricopeptide (TPR) repeat protein